MPVNKKKMVFGDVSTVALYRRGEVKDAINVITTSQHAITENKAPTK